MQNAKLKKRRLKKRTARNSHYPKEKHQNNHTQTRSDGISPAQIRHTPSETRFSRYFKLGD
ncbi:TPA: hypothetical protein ACFNMW_001908 [Neisseria lactamica]|uniref:hypothetical protein n=1 Tax=Neisseria lactamica TaxID=486 RepID=UPI001864DDED|nr:hypothetical protein [Neisseria lactamica]